MERKQILRLGAALACALVVAACCRPVLAEEDADAKARALAPREVPQTENDAARALVEEVLRQAGGNEDGLGAWTQSVIERALSRAGRGAAATTGETAPLPAEREAAGFATARANTAEVIVFTSLNVPAMSWRQWSHEVAAADAAMVLRGVAEDGFRATVQRIGARLEDGGAGVAIDPRLFRLFGIERVPAVVVVPGGVPACTSRGCATDAPPPHDLITGNTGLDAALEAIAREGEAGRETAGRHLALLRGEQR